MDRLTNRLLSGLFELTHHENVLCQVNMTDLLELKKRSHAKDEDIFQVEILRGILNFALLLLRSSRNGMIDIQERTTLRLIAIPSV